MHLLVLTQNNIAPAKYGGGLRVAGLIRQARQRGHMVSVIRFVSPGEPLSARCDQGVEVRDVQAPKGYPMAPIAAAYHLLERAAVRHALALNGISPVSVVQSDVPWASLSGHRVASRLGVPHLLLSMNCETTLARQFSRDGRARKLPLVGNLLADFNVEVVRRAEKRSIELATLTVTPSRGDIREMEEAGIRPLRVAVLPNGTNVKPVPEARSATRAALGLGEQDPAVLFVGRMDYPPNLEAVEAICNTIAPMCPWARFFLVGSNPPQMAAPSNVTVVGQVEAVEPYLAAADLSIVPLLRGSGTRIKILDAWAAGLPIISTSIGASGLDYADGRDILIEDDLSAFPRRIEELLASPGIMRALNEGALAAAVPYSWDALGSGYVETLRAASGEATGSRRGATALEVRV